MPSQDAPGWPGIPARWTSSAKSGVGTALQPNSRVWFTLGHGIVDEVYYPRIDQACIRDLGLIVTDGASYFSEEKRDTSHAVEQPDNGVPFYRLVNTARDGRYRITKEILADPLRDVVLQRISFEALKGSPDDYNLYALLAPHLANRGAANTAWVGHYKGTPLLLAHGHGHALALASSAGWGDRSAGFVGASDGWQQLSKDYRLAETYHRAANGNVALVGQLPLTKANPQIILALGFGRTAEEAGHRAVASMHDGFEDATAAFVGPWKERAETLLDLGLKGEDEVRYQVSAMVLRTHEDKSFPGGAIASLSIPWGSSKGDDDLGGYHVVWSRDLVQTIGGLLAAGAHEDARRAIDYLYTTQEQDGSWPQNMWLDGKPHWRGKQLDETALPILLLDLARSEDCLSEEDLRRFWPMVLRAASHIVRNGPVTEQDRWEEDGGFSTFTIATAIAALLAAADIAERFDGSATAAYLRATADYWNSKIDEWTYATDTPLSRKYGVEGYYVRIAPADGSDTPVRGDVIIRNRPDADPVPAENIVSPDALALVRYGLRSPDDPRIINTLKVLDGELKVDTPAGPCWYRYNGDGYGEQDDGRPFDGVGIGRLWPLLTGERAHYELAAGNGKRARELLRTFESFNGPGYLLPEQVWDREESPDPSLTFGKPTGSAMPLAWAHAEHVKLLRSLRDGRIFDQPGQSAARYETGARSDLTIWQFENKAETLASGTTLRIVLQKDAVVHWTADDWKSATDTPTSASALGVHVADLSTDGLPDRTVIRFTIHWTESRRWEGIDFACTIR